MFSRALPEFLAIGMTVEQFYDGPCRLAVAFKKAHRIRRERANFDAWLQGAYVYSAIADLAPILNGMVKNPKPKDWMDKPFELHTTSERGDQSANIQGGEERGAVNAGVAWMQSFAAAHNARLAAGRGSDSASDSNR